MKYTHKKFISDIEFMIKNKCDASTIAKNVWEIYSDVNGQLDERLDSAMMSMIMMDEGPEFEMTENELKEFINEFKTTGGFAPEGFKRSRESITIGINKKGEDYIKDKRKSLKRDA